MRAEPVPTAIFSGAAVRPRDRSRRLAFLAASALLQAAAVALLAIGAPLLGPSRLAPAGPVVAVSLLQPPRRALPPLPAPSPPPAPGRPVARPATPATPSPSPRLVQPRDTPAELAENGPEILPSADPAGGDDVAGSPSATGRPDGIVGGDPAAARASALPQPPPRPPPARTHDLAAVRAGIARTLVYPPNARRNGVQGRVLIEFVLLADGRIRDLVVSTGSGVAALDAAAVAAVQAAAPFPPPGLDVLVVVPVLFRAE